MSVSYSCEAVKVLRVLDYKLSRNIDPNHCIDGLNTINEEHSMTMSCADKNSALPEAKKPITIFPNDPAIRTMGRIDDDDPERPVWVYPYTQAAFRFTGTSLTVTLINHWCYGDSHIGVIIDGAETKVRIPSGADGAHGASYGPVTLVLADHLPDIVHEAVVFKRQDGQHYLELLGFGVDAGAQVMPPSAAEPSRRIEVFGDSVSCGERNEAILYAGKGDPDVDLSSYSDSWRSYAAITARALGAQVHVTAQGGASLLDGIGWFNGPDYIGMEGIWDRIEYNPVLGAAKPWDFSRYSPHVVVVAIGQNDSHPHDFMADDYDGAEARHWRTRYVDFLRAIHGMYPQATLICTTTVLCHDPSWDRAIDEAVRTFNETIANGSVTSFGHTTVNNVPPMKAGAIAHHFLYSRNGSATPGHPRVPEHEEMARELVEFIGSLGDDIWADETKGA